jgi:hypothetical protein
MLRKSNVFILFTLFFLVSKNKKHANLKKKVHKNLLVYLKCYETENYSLRNSFLLFFKIADYTCKYVEPKFNKSHQKLYFHSFFIA